MVLGQKVLLIKDSRYNVEIKRSLTGMTGPIGGGCTGCTTIGQTG